MSGVGGVQQLQIHQGFTNATKDLKLFNLDEWGLIVGPETKNWKCCVSVFCLRSLFL